MGEDVLDLLLVNKEELTGDVLTGGSFNYSTMRQNVLRFKDKLVKRKKQLIRPTVDL